MKQLLQRWYISILLLPILVNLFTNTVTWSMVSSNPILWFLIISSCFNIILVWELILYIHKNRKSNSSSANDNKIVQKLVQLLNLDENQTILKNTNHVENLDYNYVKSLNDFIKETEKPQNHINDTALNQKLADFKNALNTYSISITRYMISNVNDGFKTISIPRDMKYNNNDLYMQRLEELDNNANLAYNQLEGLLFYLRQRDII